MKLLLFIALLATLASCEKSNDEHRFPDCAKVIKVQFKVDTIWSGSVGSVVYDTLHRMEMTLAEKIHPGTLYFNMPK